MESFRQVSVVLSSRKSRLTCNAAAEQRRSRFTFDRLRKNHSIPIINDCVFSEETIGTFGHSLHFHWTIGAVEVVDVAGLAFDYDSLSKDTK